MKTNWLPLIVVHGSADHIVPFSQGKKLFALSPAPNKKFITIAGAGHNGLYAKGKHRIFDALRKLSQETNPNRTHTRRIKKPRFGKNPSCLQPARLRACRLHDESKPGSQSPRRNPCRWTY